MLAYSPMNTVPMATSGITEEDIIIATGVGTLWNRRFGFLLGRGYLVYNQRNY